MPRLRSQGESPGGYKSLESLPKQRSRSRKNLTSAPNPSETSSDPSSGGTNFSSQSSVPDLDTTKKLSRTKIVPSQALSHKVVPNQVVPDKVEPKVDFSSYNNGETAPHKGSPLIITTASQEGLFRSTTSPRQVVPQFGKSSFGQITSYEGAPLINPTTIHTEASSSVSASNQIDPKVVISSPDESEISSYHGSPLVTPPAFRNDASGKRSASKQIAPAVVVSSFDESEISSYHGSPLVTPPALRNNTFGSRSVPKQAVSNVLVSSFYESKRSSDEESPKQATPKTSTEVLASISASHRKVPLTAIAGACEESASPSSQGSPLPAPTSLPSNSSPKLPKPSTPKFLGTSHLDVAATASRQEAPALAKGKEDISSFRSPTPFDLELRKVATEYSGCNGIPLEIKAKLFSKLNSEELCLLPKDVLSQESSQPLTEVSTAVINPKRSRSDLDEDDDPPDSPSMKRRAAYTEKLVPRRRLRRAHDPLKALSASEKPATAPYTQTASGEFVARKSTVPAEAYRVVAARKAKAEAEAKEKEEAEAKEKEKAATEAREQEEREEEEHRKKVIRVWRPVRVQRHGTGKEYVDRPTHLVNMGQKRKVPLDAMPDYAAIVHHRSQATANNANVALTSASSAAAPDVTAPSAAAPSAAAPSPAAMPPRSMFGSFLGTVTSSVSRMTGILPSLRGSTSQQAAPVSTDHVHLPVADQDFHSTRHRNIFAEAEVGRHGGSGVTSESEDRVMKDPNTNSPRKRKRGTAFKAKSDTASKKAKPDTASQQAKLKKSSKHAEPEALELKPADYWVKVNRARYTEQKEHDAKQRTEQGTFGLFYDEDPDEYDEEADENPAACLTKDEMVQKFFLEHFELQDIPPKDVQQRIMHCYNDWLQQHIIGENHSIRIRAAALAPDVPRNQTVNEVPKPRIQTQSNQKPSRFIVIPEHGDYDPFAYSAEINRNWDKLTQAEKDKHFDDLFYAKRKQSDEMFHAIKDRNLLGATFVNAPYRSYGGGPSTQAAQEVSAQPAKRQEASPAAFVPGAHPTADTVSKPFFTISSSSATSIEQNALRAGTESSPQLYYGNPDAPPSPILPQDRNPYQDPENIPSPPRAHNGLPKTDHTLKQLFDLVGRYTVSGKALADPSRKFGHHPQEALDRLKRFDNWLKLANECLEARRSGDTYQWRPKSIEKKRHADWIEPLTEDSPSGPSNKRRKVTNTTQDAAMPWAATAEKNRAPYSGRQFADNMYVEQGKTDNVQTASLKRNSFSVHVPEDDIQNEPSSQGAASCEPRNYNTSPPSRTSGAMLPAAPSVINARSEALARERQKAEKYKSKTPTNLRAVSRLSSSPMSASLHDSDKENTAPGIINASNEFNTLAWPKSDFYVDAGVCNANLQRLMDERWTSEHQEAGFEHFQRGSEAFRAAETNAETLGVGLEVLVD